jgi:hypothetical protein
MHYIDAWKAVPSKDGGFDMVCYTFPADTPLNMEEYEFVSDPYEGRYSEPTDQSSNVGTEGL